MFENMIGTLLEAFLVECILIYLWITRGKYFTKMAIYT
jgi:hypothetical protein